MIMINKRFFLFFTMSVSNDRPVHVTIYKVKKTDKDSYKKRTSWLLKEMKTVDGKDAYTVSICFELISTLSQ